MPRYSGPDAAELHRAAVASGAAVDVPTGTPRLLARIQQKVGVLTFNSPEVRRCDGATNQPPSTPLVHSKRGNQFTTLHDQPTRARSVLALQQLWTMS